MTAGADGFTLDGMSMERIEKLIQKLRDHSYQPNPCKACLYCEEKQQ